MDRPSRHPSGYGIDLERWHLDVRRILLAVHGRRIRSAGLDPDDVLQIVYSRILRANGGEHPYDPSRASLSRYVAVQGMSAIRNELDRLRRRGRWEQVGCLDAEGIERDVASLDLEDESTSMSDAVLDLATSETEEHALLLMGSGASDAEVRACTGLCAVVLRSRLRSEGAGGDIDDIDLMLKWMGAAS